MQNKPQKRIQTCPSGITTETHFDNREQRELVMNSYWCDSYSKPQSYTPMIVDCQKRNASIRMQLVGKSPTSGRHRLMCGTAQLGKQCNIAVCGDYLIQAKKHPPVALYLQQQRSSHLFAADEQAAHGIGEMKGKFGKINNRPIFLRL